MSDSPAPLRRDEATPPAGQYHHLYAEHTSRYDLRCVKCGQRAREGGPEWCPIPDEAPAR